MTTSCLESLKLTADYNAMSKLKRFRNVWIVDFEFYAPDGELPKPICMVAHELRTGEVCRMWLEGRDVARGLCLNSDDLFVAYYASAEFGCYLALGERLPCNVLDLFTEFRNLTNGRSLPCGAGLLGALTYHGISSMDAALKDEMRDLAMRGGPFTDDERAQLMEYCEADVLALARLLVAMLPGVDIPRALHRGRYMKAAAHMERTGIPVDAGYLQSIRDRWESIQSELIAAVDIAGIYDEAGTFKSDRWLRYVRRSGIPWPLHESGRPKLDDRTFSDMARRWPSIVAPYRELRHALSQLRLERFSIGSDGRNRCLLSAFRSKTGRNQPSNTRCIFGASVWTRFLIRPEPGTSLAYIDWEQQEFGIAAALSRDGKMQEAYRSGDPYLTFAMQAGAVPPTATRNSHPNEREQFKVCALAVQYGMGPYSLAQSLGVSEERGRQLLRLHQRTYPDYWSWSEAAIDHAGLFGWLQTVFGWRVHTENDFNPRSLANFPCQANGAEMLRLACCFLTEDGIKVCWPIHDAVLVEADETRIDATIERSSTCLSEASRIVLDGFELRSDVKKITPGDRFTDDRGERMWQTIKRLVPSEVI